MIWLRIVRSHIDLSFSCVSMAEESHGLDREMITA